MRRLPLAFLLLLACGRDSELSPTDSDTAPEVTLWGTALRQAFAIDDGWHTSSPLRAPSGATRVGVLLEASDGPPAMEARGFSASGTPGPWQRLEITWAEGALYVARADLGMEAFGAQLRLASLRGLRSLTWSAVVPAPPSPVGALGEAHQALRPELGDLVVDRATWGARPTECTAADPAKTRMAIHHTVTPADIDPARIRGIQAYHMDSRGWCDIGYHFLITRDGTIYEGRPLDLRGAHVGGHNTGNVGVSLVGCFHTSGCMDWTPFEPPEAMIDAAAAIVGRITALYDIPIDAERVKGHRDHAGATTTCPGDYLHARLDDIRSRAGDASTGLTYRASFVSQSFPLASEGLRLAPGAELAGEIAMRNDGTATWRPGETFLGTTEPRDGPSPLEGSDWLSPTRPASVDGIVAPGEVGRFQFSVRAPSVAGDYAQHFNLVQEGVGWFSSPPDDQLQVRVIVDADPRADAGTDAGTGAADAGWARADAGEGSVDAGATPDAAVRSGAVSSGCGCRSTGTSAPPLGTLLLLCFALRWRHGPGER